MHKTPSPGVAQFGTGSAIGIRFDLNHGQACASLVSASHDPRRMTPELAGFLIEPLPDGLSRQVRELELDRTSHGQRELIVARVTDVASRLVQQLISATGARVHEILALGVHGCAAWDAIDSGSRSYQSLCNAAALAEATGLTVIDDFPARDLAQGGLGGPVEAHGLWFLLADRLPVPGRRWRALAQLSETFHITVIPPLDDLARRDSLVSYDIGPGRRMFTELLARFAPDRADAIDFGRLAVQGKLVHEVSARWRALISDDLTWRPHGVNVLPFLCALDADETLRGRASLHDLLATATHILAERITAFINHRLLQAQPIGELVLMGQCRHNVLLLSELRRQLPVVQIRTIDELGFDDHILAASIAALTLLHLWQVPLAPSQGADKPRVLGRLTPGNPSNWHRVLRVMNEHAPRTLPLREAI